MMNQHQDVRFRGKLISALTREEAIEALSQALDRVKELEGRPVNSFLRSAALDEPGKMDDGER